MGLNKDKYIIDNLSSSNSVNAISIDKDEDINISGSANTTNINKNKYISNSFADFVINKIGKNTRKQLTIRKSKIFIAIINYKKSYLLKKILAIKFF